MKKTFLILSLAISLLLSGCAGSVPEDSGKITVVATLFPQYDFARQIGGDKVDVKLLLPAGQESHLYDPTPSDMTLISKSDIFVYTGEMMEGWAADIASSFEGKIMIVDASKGASLYETDKQQDDEHDHHSADPHIWLDFDNAKVMAKNIYDALVSVSPENEEYFSENLSAYEEKLTALDEEYSSVFASSDKTLVFGGRFALGYLMRRYNVKYMSAYSSCGAEAEPGVKDIQNLYNYVKDNDVKAVYCEEFSDPKVARSIASANNAEVLVLHSAHNTSAEEREENATFISIMEQNLENIRKGLE